MIKEEELKRIIDEYGNIKYQVDSLKSSLQTAVDTILQRYPDAKQEFEDLQEELGTQLKNAEAKEKECKKILDIAIEAFTKDAPIKDKMIVKSKLAKVSLTKEITYDSSALDGMAIENPKLLAFRTEKIKSRVTLNNL